MELRLEGKEVRLCYIDMPWVYFTSQTLENQWGDDWNDAPYEHNAGTPYESDEWEIVKIAIECQLEVPADRYLNSPFSVQDINALNVPWLQGQGLTVIAGTLLEDFYYMPKITIYERRG